jgi:hypothetical protein
MNAQIHAVAQQTARQLAPNIAQPNKSNFHLLSPE